MLLLEEIVRTLEHIGQNQVGLVHQFVEESRLWWHDKAALFPALYGFKPANASVRVQAQERHPIIACFTEDEFRAWYAEFFMEGIKHQLDVLTDSQTIEILRSVEGALRILSPQDPTIYPLIEKPLSHATRTTALEGGTLSFIDALLPNGALVKVVAKKIPATLKSYFEREVMIHRALANLGHEHKVVLPVHVESRNRIITYGHFRGDLSCIRNASDSTKKKYLCDALDLLIDISSDLASRIEHGERRNSLGFEPIKAELASKSYSSDFLVERFCHNFILRLPAALDGVNPLQTVFEDFYLVLMKKKMVNSIPNVQKYPALASVAQSEITRKMVCEYTFAIADLVGRLSRYPGHDDFTVSNILAKEIEVIDADKIFIREMRLHDIGLVQAPFQSYIFDLAVSAKAGFSLQQDLVIKAYLKLQEVCEQKKLPFQESLHSFQEGYLLVAADKFLKQAAVQFLYQHLKLGSNGGEEENLSPGEFYNCAIDILSSYPSNEHLSSFISYLHLFNAEHHYFQERPRCEGSFPVPQMFLFSIFERLEDYRG